MTDTVEWLLIGGPGHGNSVLVPEHDGSYTHVDYDSKTTEYYRLEVASGGKIYYIGTLD